MTYQIELVWNRESDFVRYGDPIPDLKNARARARGLLNMGDGASVKKARIVCAETGEVVVPNVSA